ncbi:hypothetical protein VN97_g10039 [Penicillium thymicola]|uniref:Uncharacterized protein n=1 Tax=Penicillium thymicola TaxID=293382 RepID=A0AAI9TAE3_PENTH|nr:hypothetical protein VN97_g10039 [Penicillium thymicola]
MCNVDPEWDEEGRKKKEGGKWERGYLYLPILFMAAVHLEGNQIATELCERHKNTGLSLIHFQIRCRPTSVLMGRLAGAGGCRRAVNGE